MAAYICIVAVYMYLVSLSSVHIHICILQVTLRHSILHPYLFLGLRRLYTFLFYIFLYYICTYLYITGDFETFDVTLVYISILQGHPYLFLDLRRLYIFFIYFYTKYSYTAPVHICTLHVNLRHSILHQYIFLFYR